MRDFYIGISGWRYAPWRGVFYPDDLPQARELEFASRALPTIELNGSFYSLQRPELYAQWYASTPRGFMFSVKAPRFITHIKRLKDIEAPLANFFASGLFNLREKLGPILWQFPPNFQFDAERFQRFLEQLPHDTAAASKLAEKHDARLDGRAELHIDRKRKLYHVVEIRHPSFVVPEFVALLREHRVSLVVADTAGKWPLCEDITGDVMYLRLHGDKELYASGYSETALKRWRDRIRDWHRSQQPHNAKLIDSEHLLPHTRVRSRPVFCYFDNDIKVHAPFDAARLLELLH